MDSRLRGNDGLPFRCPREGDPKKPLEAQWIPAFARMTGFQKEERPRGCRSGRRE